MEIALAILPFCRYMQKYPIWRVCSQQESGQALVYYDHLFSYCTFTDENWSTLNG